MLTTTTPLFHKAMKRANPKTKVPRVYVEGSQASFFKSIGNNRLHSLKTVSLLDELVKKNSFDRIVWDSPFNFFKNSRTALNELTELLVSLRGELGQGFMASPADHTTPLNIELFKKLPIDCSFRTTTKEAETSSSKTRPSVEVGQKHRLPRKQPALSTRDVALLAKQHKWL